MAFISGKRVGRRTILRGMGVAMSLPFLDAMVPARGLWSKNAAAATLGHTRLVCIEDGAWVRGASAWGATQNLWSRRNRHGLRPLADIAQPARAVPQHLTIISNDVRPAEAFSQPEIGGDHFRSSAVFLTQAHPKQTESSDVRAGISLDQLYANKFGQDTRFHRCSCASRT